jgi:hypothetical protein
MTLEEIKAGFSGVDEAEQVKRAIYQEARDNSVGYVMLVGDMDVFPVRYQFRGYLAGGNPYYSRSTSYCSQDPCNWCCEYRAAYRSHAIDAYYANLWDDDDPTQAFETWDDDGNGYYGEMYCNDVRGTDGNTLHPDVALGRVPADTPTEFLTYLGKVLVYENGVAASPSRDRAFLIAGDGGGSWETERTLGAVLGDAYEITYLIEEGGAVESKDPSGTISPVASPSAFVSDHISLDQPRYVDYAGHGNATSWSEVGFGVASASALTNADLPANVTSAGCSTARFALEQADSSPPAAPYTGADLD